MLSQTTDIDTRETLTRQLEADGFAPGRPRHVSRECIAIDRQTAAETTCLQCGHVGLKFVAYRHREANRREYRSLIWCPECGASDEL